MFSIVLYTFKKKNRRENFNNQEQVNIVMSCDKNQFEGLVAIVNSILIPTKQKNRLFSTFW